MKNNKGFSLIEIMIAIGLLMGLSVWMMHLFKQQTKNEKTTAANLDIDAIGNEIRNILGDGMSCAKTFKGVPPVKAGAATAVYKLLADGTYQKRQAVGERKNQNTGVSVKSYDLKQEDVYIIPEGKTIGETMLTVVWDKGTAVYGSQSKDFKIPLSVTLDENGNIESCHALASVSNLASLCNALGRSVDTNGKKSNPPAVYVKGDMPIYTKSYIRCQGGVGPGEHVLTEWESPAKGSVRLSWSGLANDTSVTWKVFKNNETIYSLSGSGISTDNQTQDVEVAKGDKIRHTVTLSGGIEDDCVSDGTFVIGVDLLNML